MASLFALGVTTKSGGDKGGWGTYTLTTAVLGGHRYINARETIDDGKFASADEQKTNIPLLYFAYHVMAGLGTMFIAMMAAAAFFLWRGTLFARRWLLWALMLAVPFPFIANTAGWMTAEIGRQPWLVYGLLRTAEGSSSNVSAANGLFTLLGFMGLYALLTLFLIFLFQREVERGPA
jgi:cytochrome d ubiquinol oxidase subunit I